MKKYPTQLLARLDDKNSISGFPFALPGVKKSLSCHEFDMTSLSACLLEAVIMQGYV